MTTHFRLFTVAAAALVLGVLVPASVALSQGEARCTGANFFGQLGIDSQVATTTPATVNGLTNVTKVAAGTTHTLAVRSDGTLWAWGGATSGQLGIGPTTLVRSETPVQVIGIADAVDVVAGHYFTLCLRANGQVMGFGRNSTWQLGLGGTTSTSVMTPTLLPNLVNVVAIDAGVMSGIALRADGAVFTWGLSTSGQGGHGNENSNSTPAQIGSLSGVQSIAAGNFHCLALRNDGTVVAWGSNTRGQLGDGTTEMRLAPVPVAGLVNVIAIAAGGSHSLALLSDGSMRAWGKNEFGQLGTGTTGDALTPQPVLGIADVDRIAAGAEQSFAHTDSGEVFAWGLNLHGQLGDGTDVNRPLPVSIPGFDEASSVACGGFHTIGVTPGSDCPANIATGPGSESSVNIDDLLMVISAWGACPPPPNPCPANIVNSGASATQVDIDDLLAVISAWGPCP